MGNGIGRILKASLIQTYEHHRQEILDGLVKGTISNSEELNRIEQQIDNLNKETTIDHFTGFMVGAARRNIAEREIDSIYQAILDEHPELRVLSD